MKKKLIWQKRKQERKREGVGREIRCGMKDGKILSQDVLQNEEERHDFVKKLITVTRVHRRILEKEVSRTGVYRGQHQILMYVSAHPNASQKEIADLQNVSPATVAVSLKKLEKAGYLERRMDEEDNRFKQIELTEKGKKTVEISREIFRNIEEIMLDGVSVEDMSQMETVLKHIFDNFIRLLPEKEKEEFHW